MFKLEDRLLFSGSPAPTDVPSEAQPDAHETSGNQPDAPEHLNDADAAVFEMLIQAAGEESQSGSAAASTPGGSPTLADIGHTAHNSNLESPVAQTSTLDVQLEGLSESGPLANAGVHDTIRHELLVIDGKLSNPQQLAGEMMQSKGSNVEVNILVLDASSDGLTQISAYLDQQAGLGQRFDAIHLVTHGQQGTLQIGTTSLRADDFVDGSAQADQLAAWADSLTQDADILVYGCNVGASEGGVELIHRISSLTGADVSASVDNTGVTELGGNWILESSYGLIESEVLTANLDHLLTPAPLITVDVPENPYSGESFTGTIFFDNTSAVPTEVGYGPFVDMRVSAGIDITPGSFTYLGSPVTVLGQYVNNTGLPMVIDHPISQINSFFGTGLITLQPGEEYYVLELPFGSFVPAQPIAPINFQAITDKTELPANYLPNQAGTQGTVSIQVGGGYRYGSDPLDNPGTDAPIYTPPVANNEDGITTGDAVGTDEIRPRIWEVTKTLDEKESETAKGPNDPQTWTITVNVAAGETVTNVQITDILENNLVYLAGTATITGGTGALVVETPIAGQPNNAPNNDFLFTISSITGGVSGTEVTISYQTHVPFLDANGVPVLNQASGNDRPIVNGVNASATYDPDGAGGVAAYTILDQQSGDPLTEPNQVTLSAESLTIQKGVSDLNGGNFVPGDTLGWNLVFQTSDFFQFNDLFIIDRLGDGQLFIDKNGNVVSGVVTPTFLWSENGTNFVTAFDISSPSADLSPITDVAHINFGNLVVFYNGTTVDQTFNASVYEPDASSAITVGAGETILLFRVSEQMVAAGGDAILRGDGLVGPSALTAGMTLAQLNTAMNNNIGNGQTNGQIQFRSVVQREYITGPSGDVSLDMGDFVDNTVEIDGRILRNTDNAAQQREQDGSGASIEINGPDLTKDIFAIANSTSYTTPIVGSGEPVTWKLGAQLSLAAVELLTIDDYVPLPKFLVTEFNGAGTNVNILSDVTVYKASVFDALPTASQIPPAGKIFVVLGDDVYDALALTNGPQVIVGATSNSEANSFRVNFGTFDLPPALASIPANRDVEVYFSLTATDAPMADGLFLTNQQQTNYQDTGIVSGVGEAIVQVQVEEPVLDIQKGVVASTQGGGLTLGGIVFNPVTGSGFTGTVATPTEANAIGASDLVTGVLPDAGDVVRYALVVQNTGRADAFDVTFSDSVDYNLFFNTDPANKAAFLTDTGLKVYLGNGTLLTEGTHYTLTYNGDANPLTGDFVIELIDGATGLLAEGLQANGTAILTGLNTVLVTYDLTLATATTPNQTYVNTTSLTKYTGQEGSTFNRLPTPDTEIATILTALPVVSKDLISTSVTTGNNSNTQAVVGELVQYSVTVRVPEGTVPGAVVVDTMDPGLAFVGINSVTTSAGITSTRDLATFGTGVGETSTTNGAGVDIFVQNSGGTITFKLGDLTNSNTNNAVLETVVINYTAVVLNTNTLPSSPGNQSGTLLNNSAEFEWTNNTDTLAAVSAPNVTVIEPALAVDKQASADNVTYSDALTGVDAGDFVFFRIRLTNASGAPTAFDLALNDVLPSNLSSLTVVSTALTNASGGAGGTLSVTDGGSNTLDISDFAITGSTLALAGGRNMDLGGNSRLEIVVRGTLDYSITPTQSITNTASATWTSIDGTPGTISTFNTNSTERTGAGGPGTDAAVLNNYSASDATTFTIRNVNNTKSIVATSESFTSVVAGTQRVAIGEIIRYRLVVEIPEGTLPTMLIDDNLPTGLLFVNDGTATIGFVSDGGTNITSTTISGAGLNVGASIIAPTFVLGDTAISTNNAPATNSDGWVSGTDPQFRLGTIQNLENDANAEYIVIEFNAVVLNTFNTGNQTNTQLRNNFDTYQSADGGANYTFLDASNNSDVRVAEPNLTVSKTTTQTAPVDAGDSFAYTITVANNASGDNAAPAFDVRVQDAVDAITASNPTAELEFLSYSLGTLPSGTSLLTDASSTATDILDLTFNRLNAGDSFTITVNVQVKAGALASAEIENKAVVTYTSLPGTTGTLNGTIATTYGTTDVDLNPGTDSTLTSALNGSTVTGGTLTTLTGQTTERTGANSEATANDNTPPSDNGVQNNYAVAANAPALLVVAPPGLDKMFKDGSISADDTSVATSANANVVIGETVTYDILVTLPEGITSNLRVEDIIPEGLRLDSLQILTTAASTSLLAADFNGTFGTTPTLAAPVAGSSTVTFDFDDVTVVNDNVANNNSFVLRVVATVQNILPNQETITRTNTARLVYNDPDGSGNAGPAADRTVTDSNTANDPTVTIVEPTLAITKTVTPSTGDAGDPVTYTITIANTSGQAAYDVTLNDLLPTLVLTPSITTVVATGFSGGTFITPTLADFEISGGVLQNLSGFDWDMNTGSQIVITVTGSISTDVTSNSSISNTASTFWTSTDGANADERTGASDPNPGNTQSANLNNYALSSTATFTTPFVPRVSKSIIQTSEAATSFTSSTGDVLIGEVVRYELQVELFEGTNRGLVIRDFLPTGLQFLGGNIEVAYLGVNSTLTGSPIAAGTYTSTSAFISSSLTADADVYNNGSDVFFKLGTIVNNDHDVDREFAVVRFNALVLNTSPNQNTATRVNNFGVLLDTDNNGTSGYVSVDRNNDGAATGTEVATDADNDGSDAGDVAGLSNDATVTIREAVLSFNQTIPAGVGYDAGDTFSITYTITNSGSVPAYNVRLADLELPAEFDLTNISFVTTGTGGTVTDSTALGSDSIDAEISQMAAGSTWTITATVTLRDTVNPSDVYTNPANVTFTSLPGANGTTGNATGSDTPGAAGAATGERTGADGVGGALNDYALADTETLTIPNPFIVTKAADKTTVTIGEIVTYTVQVTVIEGTTTNIVLNDTLPAGMVFIANSATLTNANGMTINGFNTNSLDQTLTSVVNPGASDSNASAGTDTFTYTYQARVQNVVSNQSGTILTNDLDGSGDGVPPDIDNRVDVEVIEPDLVIDKTITTPVTGLDAGDTVTYQIVISHSGTSAANAYEVILNDVLPSSALENFTLVSAVISDGATSTDVLGSFNLSGAVLSTTGNVDLLLNTNGTNDQTLTLVISANVLDNLNVGTSFTNTATVQWSSLDGGLDGDDAGTLDERTGAGSNPPNDYTRSDDVTAATVGVLGVTKAVDKATATIGEIVTYTVTVTVAEGRTVLTLADTLPTGVALVAGSASLTTPSGWTISGFNTNSASQTLTVSNPGGSGSTTNNSATADTDTFTYTYQAVVTNTLPNQAGTTLVNDLDASADLNNDGDTTDGGETDNNNTATTTVVEPRVFIDKTATPVSGLNAGDTITYTIVLTNPNSAATSTAFDVVLTDTVPSGLLITGITSTTLAGGASTDTAISITGGGTGLTGQFDIPVDGSVTVVYTAVLQTSLVPGQSLVNDADATFTSLNGTVSGERTGGDITEPTDNTHPDSATTLNNYGVGDVITVTALSYEPLVNKSIVSTSEAGSTGTDVLIGEIVRFRLKFELFEGTLNDLVIQDYLPAELQFLNDGTASFSTLNVASTVTGASLVVADSLTGSGTSFGNGTDIFFQLGDVVNNDNDADVEYGVIEFNAIVLNTVANQEAASRTNNFGVYYDADNSGAVDAAPLNTLRVDADDNGTAESTGQSVSNSVTVTVREAALSFNQTIPAGVGYDAGDTFSITYTITNSGTVPAYNVRLADLALPAEFDLTNISFVTTGTGGTVTDSTVLGSDSIDAEISQMAAGSTWTITATVTLRDTVNPSDVYTNPANVTFTSLPGANGTTGNATGSDTPGAAGAATGERTGADGVGGALNDYALADTETLSIPNPFIVTKAADKTTVTIGEIVTYTVQVTVIEGTTTNIVLNDTLPSGMVFIANSATLTNANGMTITGFNTNSLDQTLTSVVNPGANDINASAATDAFTYTYQARVQNVVSNQSGTILTNDLDGSGDGVPPDIDNQVDVEVIEPDLNIVKTITSPTTNLDAGDTITYQIVVNHTGASTASAFDLILNDTFPTDLENITLVSAVVRDGVSQDLDVASTGTNEIQLSGSTLSSTGTLDLLRNSGGTGIHQQLIITVSGTVKNATDVGQTITNSATVLWSSLDGGLDGDDSGTLDERTGGGSNPPNDYNDSDSVQTVTKGVLNVSKVANVTEATIGDIVTYTVTFEVAAGRTVVNWADSLPVGMALIPNSVTLGANPANLSITGLNNNALTGQTITVVSTGTSGDEATTLETSTFTVTYQAIVQDVASNDGLTSAADGDGQTDLVNSVDASADLTDDGDTEDPGEKDENNEATVRVIEPRVIITKSNNDLDGVVVPGQVVTYTLTLENLAANGSTAVAYDVRVRDLVPPTLTLTIGSINVVGATVASNSSAGNTIDLTLNSLALNATATVTFTATVGTGVTGGTTIDNNAKIFYDTQPGDEGVPPGTGNTVFGETDGPTGDRDYGSTGPDEAPTPVTDDPHQDTDRLTVGNYSLGDRVWFDLNGDGVQDGSEIGIGGVTVTLLYAGNDGIFGNTDDVNLGSVDTAAGTGNYLFSNLADGSYRVTVDSSDLPDGAATIRTFDLDGIGTPHVAVATLSGASINTVDFGYRGSSSISDTIYFDANNDGDQDAGEVGLLGIDISARWAGDDGVLDTSDDLVHSTTTDANGNYSFNNLFSGDYRVDVDQADLPSGVAATPTSGGSGSNISVGTDPFVLTGATALGIGEARTTVDFGYTGTGSIGDFVFHDFDGDGVQDSGEFGLANIAVTLTWGGQDNNLATTADNVVYTTTTDANGNYLFSNLAAGNFRVDVDQAGLPGGINILTSGAGSVGVDPYTLNLAPAENNLAVDFGFRGPGSLGDTVWYDVNGDGILNGVEVGISGVTVQLVWAGLDGDFSTTADNLTLTDISDASGNYSFTNLAVDITGGVNTGLFTVSVITSTLPAGFTSPTFDLDGIGTANVATLTLAAATPNRTDVDFGYRGSGALGNRVYHDTNGNGSFDAGDLGLANIDVNLRWAGQDGNFDTADDVTYSTTTDATGNYGFSNLVAGDFRVDIDNTDLPLGITTITSGGSGADVSVGTDPFVTNLTSGENDQTVDFGYRGTGSLGDKVYADIDGDGTEDAIDYGLANVAISVTWAGLDGDFTTTADNVVYNTTTDSNGNYTVSNLAPGSYRATVNSGTLPAGYTNQTYDLDGTGTASTADLTLTIGQNRTDVDFGYKGTARIADTVWLDLDGDGTQNNLEQGIGNVTLDLIFDVNNDGLFDGGDVVIATTTTDLSGFYEFTGLVPDRYLVRVTDTNNVLTSATNTFDKDDYGTAADNGLSTVELSPDEDDSGVDFGYRGAASLGDRVWNDRNNDGVQDSGEFGIPGSKLNLYRDLNGDGDYTDSGEGQIATTTSGVDGAYLFQGLIGGNYIVEVANPPASSSNTFDKDDYGTAVDNSSAKITLDPTEDDLAVDFGYVGQASVGDYVWYDANNDGLQAGEPPLSGIRVFLDIDGNGTFDSATDPSAITDSNGFYEITGLIGGGYIARIDTSTLPAGYVPTFDRDGSGSAHVTMFQLGETENLTDVDFGYVGTITVSGRSYHDLDKNNLFDGADTGLGGVQIELIFDTNNDGTVDGGDFVVFTDTTNSDGTYVFTDVLAGNYLIRETQLAGYGSSQNATNLIDIVVTAAGSADNNFGNTTGSIAGRVFLDNNDNGIQDPSETGISNTSVTLEWSGGDENFGTADDRTITVFTDLNGDYLFDFSNTAGFVANGDSTRGLLSTGYYRILETQPTPYLDGAETVGNASVNTGSFEPGTAPDGRGADEFSGIQIGNGQDASGYNFAEIPPSSISGSVHVDNNNNGARDPFELGIRNVEITLNGLDAWGRTVSLTTTTDDDGNYTFTGLYASDKNGYTLEQPTQPPGFYDGLEGIGVGGVGGTVDVEFILNIPLDYGVDAVDYTFGEIPIPPVVPPLPPGLEIIEEAVPDEGVLGIYFYNTFEDFLPDDEEEEEPFLAEPGVEPLPILPITPMYSGHAEPGSTITIELRNIQGSVVGTETVVADAGGAWLAKFPSNIVYDVPTSVVQTVTRPTYSDRVYDDFNFRTFFAPTINPSHFFGQQFDIDRVISESTGRQEKMIQSLGGSQSFEWEGHEFEFLAQPGLPSS